MSAQAVTVVVTTISPPNDVLRAIAEESRRRNWRFVIAGDAKSPTDFSLPGAEFLSLPAQRALPFELAGLCPSGHYARKNVGYLQAIAGRPDVIVETDDDNLPREAFYRQRHRRVWCRRVQTPGWVNVYRYFTDRLVWPRGLPLDELRRRPPDWGDLPDGERDCPIQQGLADGNPDVDAIYRLVLPLPLQFAEDRRIALSEGVWCPFNSQNTTWFPPAWALLYLPSYCSFRMTDIWRSFIAQRIAWANGWDVLFHEPTVCQDRNEHDLMRDFADEIPGYMGNRCIAELLETIPVTPGIEAIGENLLNGYRALVDHGFVGQEELPLLSAWLRDLKSLGVLRNAA